MESDWSQRLEQFVEHLRHERRVGPGAQRQYRSIVKDWIELCLARGHDPAAFEMVLVEELLDRRARRNSRGVLAPNARKAYESNLRVFCRWSSSRRSRGSLQASPRRAVASSSAPSSWRQEQRAAPGAPTSQPQRLDALRRHPESGEIQQATRTLSPSGSQTPRTVPPTPSQVWVEPWQGPLPAPIEALEQLLQQGGTTIVRAAFQYSFFAHPDAVRRQSPWYPDRARTSREHYPGGNRGDTAQWQGRQVTLGDNTYAQQAWIKYSGRPIERRSGFGVRHIWGKPWDPDAFTAGWNLCYMPFWAGMLTEAQHPHPQLEETVRQAAWNLYFRTDPVCEPPDYVQDPGIDLGQLLGTQPIRVLRPESN